MTTPKIGRALETSCWLLGIALVTLYCATRAYGEIERRQAIAAFTHLPAGVESAPEHGGTALVRASLPVPDPPDQTYSLDQSSWSASRIRAHAVAAGHDQSERPTALLRIASVRLEVPVYAESTERNFNRGAGLIAGTAQPGSGGNVAIAAHRDGYFRALRSVVVGDVIELESHSEVIAYRISEIDIVDPTDIRPLDATSGSAITLVTCYPFYFVGSAPQRFIVRALAVDSSPGGAT